MAEAKPGTKVFFSAPTNSFYGLWVQFLPPKSELEKASGVTGSNLRQHFPFLHKKQRAAASCPGKFTRPGDGRQRPALDGNSSPGAAPAHVRPRRPSPRTCKMGRG